MTLIQFRIAWTGSDGKAQAQKVKHESSKFPLMFSIIRRTESYILKNKQNHFCLKNNAVTLLTAFQGINHVWGRRDCFLSSQEVVSHYCWGCQEAITTLILLLSLRFISTGTSRISQTYCLLHLRHLFTYYSLFWLSSLFLTGSKDSVEKAESLLWILPTLSLWNQGTFAQICITPCQLGFTFGMSESFLGYENPSLKGTKKSREKESSLSSRNYPSKTGWRLRYVI